MSIVDCLLIDERTGNTEIEDGGSIQISNSMYQLSDRFDPPITCASLEGSP